MSIKHPTRRDKWIKRLEKELAARNGVRASQAYHVNKIEAVTYYPDLGRSTEGPKKTIVDIVSLSPKQIVANIKKKVASTGTIRSYKGKKGEKKELSPKRDWLSEYYTPEWYARRKEILERDGFTCQKCGSKENLQVHHKVYDPRLHVWEYEGRWLVTMCHPCHEDFHKKIPGKKLYNRGRPLIRYVKKKEEVVRPS